jgi:hypothetical protein
MDNVRVCPTKGERFAIMARIAPGHEWVQVEAIMPEAEAHKFAREIEEDQGLRRSYVLDFAENQDDFDENEQPLEAPKD